jgi:hypothetical protein
MIKKFPKYFVMCRDNPTKVKRIQKMAKLFFIIYLLLMIVAIADAKDDLLTLNPVLFLMFGVFLFPLLFVRAIDSELESGLCYWTARQSKNNISEQSETVR